MVNFNDFFLNPDGSLPPELRAKIEAAFDAPDTSAAFDAINASLAENIEGYNHTAQDELGGFSPVMLSALERYKWTDPSCPLKLADDLSSQQVANAAFFQQIRTFLIALRDSGGVKATGKGNLTRSFVNEMVDVFLQGKAKEMTPSVNKVLNEEDVFPLHEARIVCKVAGLIGLTKGKISVRKKALPLLEPDAAGQLYRQLFITYFTEYNIGYGFRYGIDLDWLQFETGYVLKPLQLQANKWVQAEKIAPKLLHPMILHKLESELQPLSYMTIFNAIERYFFKPLEYWGLLEIERKKVQHFDEIQCIRKAKLFDQFIRFEDA